SQSDNHYVTISTFYGHRRPENLPRGGPGAQLLARRRQGPPDSAGGEPGRPPPRDRSRRAAVRSLVEERDAHRRRQGAPELRRATRPARRGSRISDARAARSPPRPRPHRRERSGGPYAAAAHRPIPHRASPDRDRRPPRAGAPDRRRGPAGQPRLRRADVSSVGRG